jgi:hypothetical protein
MACDGHQENVDQSPLEQRPYGPQPSVELMPKILKIKKAVVAKTTFDI